jgi:hypothetical protein
MDKHDESTEFFVRCCDIITEDPTVPYTWQDIVAGSPNANVRLSALKPLMHDAAAAAVMTTLM